jgi:hypothetical protein
LNGYLIFQHALNLLGQPEALRLGQRHEARFEVGPEFDRYSHRTLLSSINAPVP